MKISFEKATRDVGSVRIQLETTTREEWTALSKSMEDVLKYLMTTMMMEMKVKNN